MLPAGRALLMMAACNSANSSREIRSGVWMSEFAPSRPRPYPLPAGSRRCSGFLSRHDEPMWVYLPTWLVESGELPELRSGDRLTRVGVRGSCWSVQPSTGPDAVAIQLGADPDGFTTMHYRVTGTVEWTREEPTELVLRACGLRLLARGRPAQGPATLSPRRPWRPRPRPELPPPHLSDIGSPTAGTRATAHCTLWVTPDYEWEEFDLPDLRVDWTIGAIRLEQRGVRWSSAADEQMGEPAEVVGVVDVEQAAGMRDEDDDVEARHVLDLRQTSR